MLNNLLAPRSPTPWSIAKVDPYKNLLKGGNPRQDGAIVGGAVPTLWFTQTNSSPGSTIAISIAGKGVEGNIPYVDWHFAGTAGSATDGQNVFWGGPATNAQYAAVSGDILDFFVYLSLVRGSLTGFTNINIFSDDFDASHAYLGGNYASTPLNSLARRPLSKGLYTQRYTAATALTAFKNGYIDFNFTALGVVDMTVRIGYPIIRKVN